MPEPEVAAGRLGVAGPRLGAALLVLGGGVAELVVVDPRAGEVRLLAGGRGVVVVELLVDEVEHEGRVDDPDTGGEVLPAVVHEGVAAVARAVADLGVMRSLSARALARAASASSSRSSRCTLAAEDRGDLSLAAIGQVRSGVVDLFGGVEHGAVVDPDGVGVLVLDDGAVHERAEVAERLVVQVAGGDPLRDRLGELRGDLVHVGELVGHRHRDLLAGRPFGDAGADRLGQRQLAAEVVRALGARSRGRRRRRRSGRPRAGRRAPASSRANCSCWSTRRELLALLGLGLDAADLLRARLVVEQQHDQAADRLGRPSYSSLPASSWLALAAR